MVFNENNVAPATAPGDPLEQILYNLGRDGGDDTFMEFKGRMREEYGDAITDAFTTAYTENDLNEAKNFASMLVDDFKYEVTRNDDKIFSIDCTYDSVGPQTTRGITLFKDRQQEDIDIEVVAVLSASSSAYFNNRNGLQQSAESKRGFFAKLGFAR